MTPRVDDFGYFKPVHWRILYVCAFKPKESDTKEFVLRLVPQTYLLEAWPKYEGATGDETWFAERGVQAFVEDEVFRWAFALMRHIFKPGARPKSVRDAFQKASHRCNLKPTKDLTREITSDLSASTGSNTKTHEWARPPLERMSSDHCQRTAKRLEHAQKLLEKLKKNPLLDTNKLWDLSSSAWNFEKQVNALERRVDQQKPAQSWVEQSMELLETELRRLPAKADERFDFAKKLQKKANSEHKALCKKPVERARAERMVEAFVSKLTNDVNSFDLQLSEDVFDAFNQDRQRDPTPARTRYRDPRSMT